MIVVSKIILPLIQLLPFTFVFAQEPQIIVFVKNMKSIEYIESNEKKISIFFSSIVSNIDSCDFAKRDSKVRAEYAVLLSSLYLSKNKLNTDKKLEGLRKYHAKIESCNKQQMMYFGDNHFINSLRAIADQSISKYHLNFIYFFEKIQNANLSMVPREFLREYCNSLKRVGRSIASIECYNKLIGDIEVESEKIEIAKELFYSINDQYLCSINIETFDSLKMKEDSKSLLKEYTKLINSICNKSITAEVYTEGVKKVELFLNQNGLLNNWEYELKYIELSYSILSNNRDKVNSIFNYYLSKTNLDDGERGYYYYLKAMYELSVGDFAASKKSISNLVKVQNKFISLSFKIMYASCLIDYMNNDESFNLCKMNFFDYTSDSALGTRYAIYNKIRNLLKVKNYKELKTELVSTIKTYPGILEIYISSDLLNLMKK